VASAFADVAGNVNVAETESFTLQTAPAVQILDNGDAGYTAPGFVSYSGIGYQSDVQYSAAHSGRTATWSFSGLASGTYRVSATWVPNPNRATNAPYTISDAGGTVAVNQEQAPNDFSDAGVSWEDLVTGLSVTDGTLQVSLTDVGANEYVIADAIRVERVGALHAASVGAFGLADATGLTEADVAHVRTAAAGYWSATELTAAARLSDTQVVIADLPATLLGVASAWTQTVWLDADAAGYGWPVEAESRERRAESWDQPPEPRTLNPEAYDLLTVLTHELGHVLGYDDLDPLSGPPSIMTGVLTSGTRRVPAVGELGPASLVSAPDGSLSGSVDAWLGDLGRFDPSPRLKRAVRHEDRAPRGLRERTPDEDSEGPRRDTRNLTRRPKDDEELLEVLARGRTPDEEHGSQDDFFARLGDDAA
jgi:hypothetical protein